jgi:hypothetical protein
MVFKSGCFSCFWTYSLFAPKPSIVSQSSAHESCQQKSQWLLNTSPPHVMSSVILYRVETSRLAGWDNGGEPEVTVPYACTMTRQWRHRGQVTVHLLPVWQLFLEVYRNQERWLLMSQHISSIFLFVSFRSCARSLLTADVALQLCGRELTQTAVFYRSRSGDRLCNDELPATNCINSMFLALLNYRVWSLGGLQPNKKLSSFMKSRCRRRHFRPKVMKYPANGKRISWLNFMFCRPCISIDPCNENQLDALFILNLFRQSTSTCFGHICSQSSGDILYIYNNW